MTYRSSAAAVFILLATPVLAGGEHAHSHGNPIGQPGVATEATRTIDVVMTDNAFSVASITVNKDETVLFRIRNAGEFLHELNLGTPESHLAHQQEMAGMMDKGHIDAHSMMMAEGMHDDPNALMLEAGQTGELVWQFTEAGTYEFACNLPGHYESGMVGQLEVHG